MDRPIHKLDRGSLYPVCKADPEDTPFRFTFSWNETTCKDCLKVKRDIDGLWCNSAKETFPEDATEYQKKLRSEWDKESK